MRIFHITPGMMDAFLAARQAGVYPLRIAHGFRIDSAWARPTKIALCGC